MLDQQSENMPTQNQVLPISFFAGWQKVIWIKIVIFIGENSWKKLHFLFNSVRNKHKM